MTILVTGGAGYIGTHTIIELINNNYDVVVIDNLSNSSREALLRVEQITNTTIPFYSDDVRDENALNRIFDSHPIDAVIHFAGLKAVGESTKDPLLYYDTNIGSSMSLLSVMRNRNCNKIVFSSSATVYGSAPIPYSEESQTGVGVTNPYGRTKYMIEQILSDASHADESFECTILRYFNPVGAHESGRIGEDPSGTPNNLMPYITQVATGRRDKLNIFGGDYPTLDGTGVRDYIHVSDLARGHVAALSHSKPGCRPYNLGSGTGVSVLQLVEAFEEASGVSIPYEIVPRRPGDLAEYYADAELAFRELDWKVEKSILDACRDSWNWQSNNPNGYNTTQQLPSTQSY
jgi:UDP-glucose 4-epimerase